MIGAIRRGLRDAGFPVEFSKGEAGRGQHELNLTYQDALEMADTTLVFKNAVKEIAAQHGSVGHVHGQAALRRQRLERPHPLQPVGGRRRRKPHACGSTVRRDRR